jgi:Fe-S-cluster-containing dehydrogenase component
VPKYEVSVDQMMKCDYCYDRTSTGKRPMCATVCPSQALFYGTREEIERLRPRSVAINTFQFGQQTITTKVNMMVPRDNRPTHIDVLSAMHAESPTRRVGLTVIADDPFAHV